LAVRGRLFRESVSNGNSDIAILGRIPNFIVKLASPPAFPSTAVNENEGWIGAIVLSGAGHIQPEIDPSYTTVLDAVSPYNVALCLPP
jgi:hypothetical protein